MWEIVQNIGTPISLIAFVAAVICYAFLGSQKHKIELLKALPEEKRWELLNKELEGYNVTQDDLTREQKFELMKTVLMQKAEHRKRIIYTAFVVCGFVSLVAGASVTATYIVTTPRSEDSVLRLISVFGQLDNGESRVKIIQKSDNNLLLNQAFANSKSEVKIVTELGNTWLLGDNYQAFKGVIDRKLKITVLMFDFTNVELRDLARYSSQKGEGKQGYTPDEVIRGLETYSQLLSGGAMVNFGSYSQYPWVRFTIFDDTAVSFVLRPVLNLSRPQPFYSTDPVIVKMFEGIYKEFEKKAEMYRSATELDSYISRYKVSVR